MLAILVMIAPAWGKTRVGLRMLRAPRSCCSELEAFDAALTALAHRSGDALDAALHDMRLSEQAGFAMLLEAVGGSLMGRAAEADNGDLTAMELQILRCMARGLSNQAIADDQRRTVNTVRTHVSAVLRKLGAGTRGEAVAVARRRELV